MEIVNITPQVKFSLDVCRGSSEDRRNFAAQLNEQIFDNIEGTITKNGLLKISDYEKALAEVLPEPKRVDVIEFTPLYAGEEGSSDLIEDDDANYIGQTIEVPSASGYVARSGIVTLFHESRHVLDNLSNPKYMARVKSMYARDLYSRSYNNISDKFYNDIENPTPENREKELKSLEKKLRNFLKKKPVEAQVDCLQDLRYMLETERNAFADQYKFETRLRDKGINTGEFVLEDESKYFLFDEKINMIKGITAEIIGKERKKHRLSLEG